MSLVQTDFRVNLDGKVAFVTGGGRGIGRTCALALARSGAKVVLCSRTLSQCQDVATEIESLGVGALPLSVDLSVEGQVKGFVDQGIERFGRMDILLNNAGIVIRKNVEDSLPSDWRQVLDVNLIAPAYLASQAIPYLVATQGCIVNISSMVGSRAMLGKAAYASSKAALTHLTRLMALEFGPKGVRINAVAPGRIMTPMQANRPGDPEAILDRIALRRLGKPEDIAATVLFLVSDAASYITGQIVVVDGGWSIGLA